MKKLLFPLLIFMTSISFSQDINGVWQDSTGTAFNYCVAIFSVKNDSVFMTHYLEFNGTPFVEYGAGVSRNDSLIYKVTVSRGIPGWSSAGIHRLKISADKKTLKGTYSDNLGNNGAIVFKRISK